MCKVSPDKCGFSTHFHGLNVTLNMSLMRQINQINRLKCFGGKYLIYVTGRIPSKK